MTIATGPIDRTRHRSAVVTLFVLGLILIALWGRVIHVNASEGQGANERRHTSRSIIPSRRGCIFDARGRVVATSRHKPDVFVDPSLINEKKPATDAEIEAFAEALSVRIDVPAEFIAEKIRSRRHTRFVEIARRVDDVTAEAIDDMDHRAVGLIDHATRDYPLGSSMGQVLGLVGVDGAGLEGVELTWDSHLRGVDGKRATVRDVRRRALWVGEGTAIPPTDGGHVVLTIDAEIQGIAEAVLARRMAMFDAESGVVIVMAPRTADVLAMASWPTFDPNDPNGQPAFVRRNRAVTDPMEPGSTFKPFIACGALAGGYVTVEERFDCHMGYHVFGRRPIRDSSPHGMLALPDIVRVSSNIGMATVAERMGNQALHDIVRAFGFGTPTGLDCAGEGTGLVRPLAKWSKLSTQSVPMGYEISVTPLQLIRGFCAILNDGVLLRPRLVKQLLGPDGSVVKSFDESRIVRRVVPAEVAQFMAQTVLPSVVANGTGRRAKLATYQVLGKTGTAKLPYPDRAGYEPGAYMAAFIGAAPVRDPQAVALVMIRRPNAERGYYGGKVSAPAVAEILDSTLAYMQIEPDGVMLAVDR